MDKITDIQCSPRISIVGLGKLGSPMAAVFAAKGYEVVGLDLNPEFVTAINEGRAPVQEPQLDATIQEGRSRLRAVTSYDDAIRNTDVTMIIVPTPSGTDLFFTNKYVIDSVESIGRVIKTKPGYHVVVISSTVMPGSTGSVIRAALERTSGRKVGPDLGLCYNPEFIALGSVVKDLLNPDMILIGESDKKAGDILEAIYRKSTISNPEFRRMNWVNAELCKISVNTYVTTKISYANMIAEMCDHLEHADADVVTQAVGADSRIGRKYLRGAIGYGGPCFPRDNKAFAALGRKLGVNTALAEATDNINEHQLQRLRGAVEAHAPEGGTVAILGMSYKPDTAVIEEAQGVALAGILAREGYKVIIADPLAAGNAKGVLGSSVDVAPSLEFAAGCADVVVITTPWKQFAAIPGKAYGSATGRTVVVDPWGIIDGTDFAPSAILVKLGRGDWRFEVEGDEAVELRHTGS